MAWQNERMTTRDKAGKKRQGKTLAIVGLAVWLLAALLFAVDAGPFTPRPLQWIAIAGFGLFAFGLVQRWRYRETPAGN